MSAPRYDSYRESGVEWVGGIPTHWMTEPLWTVAEECDRPNVGMIENNLLSLSYGRIVKKDINNNDGLLPASFETYQIVEPDDVVWRLTDLQNDKRSLRTARVPERGIITSAYLATRPHRIDSSYFSYLLRAYDLMKVFYSMGGGLRQGMKFSDVRRLPILLPSPPEQAAIVAFLDRETGKIDALVEAQTRLIELLKEKRQAVISHAVTKGLDPAVPMKDSGIEWLGQVPAHWEVQVLGRIIDRIEQGWSPAAHDREPDVGEASVLRLSAVKDGRFVGDKRKALPDLSADDLASAPCIRAGDFLFTRANTPDLVGDCAITSEMADTIFSDLIYRLTFSKDVVPKFMLHVLRSSFARWQIRRDARGSSMSMAKLSHGHIKAWWVAVPPKEEQERIAAAVAMRTAELDRLEFCADQAITLLLERRAAMISAAVTGNIDVRGFVPEQAEAA